MITFGKNKILYTLLLSALCVANVSHARPGAGKGNPNKLIPVMSEVVEQHQIAQSVALVGKLKAKESVEVSPQVSGMVTHIAVSANQHVKTGQLLLTLDDNKAKAIVAEANAYLSDEQRKLTDLHKLIKQNAITQSELDAQIAKVDIAKARLQAANADLNYHHLRAPFSGTLGFIDFSVGKMVSNSDQLLHLDDLNKMELDLQVPERYLAYLQTGMTVTATSQAWLNTTFNGHIIGIDPRINPETLNLRIRVAFDNPKLQLKPGMLMAAKLTFPPVTAPVIPVQALEYSGSKRFVYVINKQKVTRTEIELGTRIDDRVIVNQGLNIGDSIVVQGLVNMRDGVKVNDLSKTAHIANAEEIH